MEASLLGHRGALHWKIGRPEEARAEFLEAISLLTKLGDLRRKAIWLSNFGEFLVDRGEIDASDRAFEEARAILRSIGASVLEAEVQKSQKVANAARKAKGGAKSDGAV